MGEIQKLDGENGQSNIIGEEYYIKVEMLKQIKYRIKLK